MLLATLLQRVVHFVRPVVERVESKMKTWTQPPSVSLIGGTMVDLMQSKSALMAENAFLRQQLMVLKRQVNHPKLSPLDRGLLVALASRVQRWRNVLLIVKPETLVLAD